MPSHKHYSAWSEKGIEPWGSDNSYTHTGEGQPADSNNPWAFTSPVGGDKPHNNIPPYMVIYIFTRSARKCKLLYRGPYCYEAYQNRKTWLYSHHHDLLMVPTYRQHNYRKIRRKLISLLIHFFPPCKMCLRRAPTPQRSRFSFPNICNTIGAQKANRGLLFICFVCISNRADVWVIFPNWMPCTN